MTGKPMARVSLRKARRLVGARPVFYPFHGELVPVIDVRPLAKFAVVTTPTREFNADWDRQVFIGRVA